MALINKINVGDTTYDLGASLLYGVCETLPAVPKKVVTVTGNFTLQTGATIAVKFTYTNIAAAPTLNVNGTGEKTIKIDVTNSIGTSPSLSWMSGAVVIFVYDGEYWYRTYNDTDSTYTNSSLGQGYAICSTAASTVDKTATISHYTLAPGGIVVVKFTNGITVANPTLSISNTGARKIFYKGSALTDTSLVRSDDTVSFIYDGTQYQIFSIDRDNDTDFEVTQNRLPVVGTEAKILFTAPGITNTNTGQTYFYEGLGYNGETITANSTGVICTDEDSSVATTLNKDGLHFGYDSINNSSSFRIDKYGSPAGEGLGPKQGWREYLDIYVQDTAPADDTPVGTIWIDTSVSSITYTENVTS